jgi:histidinol-phosphate phosphatase family protein
MIQFQSNLSFTSNPRKAVFFDRDGVINPLIKIDGVYTSPKTSKQFKFYPNVFQSFEKVKRAGYMTFIVTNQPGVIDGVQTMEELNELTSVLMDWLAVDGIYNAIDKNSNMYKPGNGMLEFFINQFNLEREKCHIIGDRWKDIVPGHTSGINTIFVGEKYEAPAEYSDVKPDCTCSDVYDACNYIVETNYERL